jgi:hypothetical protein
MLANRKQSLAGTGVVDAIAGSLSSSIAFDATSAPAAVALVCKNSRREKCEVMIASRKSAFSSQLSAVSEPCVRKPLCLLTS